MARSFWMLRRKHVSRPSRFRDGRAVKSRRFSLSRRMIWSVSAAACRAVRKALCRLRSDWSAVEANLLRQAVERLRLVLLARSELLEDLRLREQESSIPYRPWARRERWRE